MHRGKNRKKHGINPFKWLEFASCWWWWCFTSTSSTKHFTIRSCPAFFPGKNPAPGRGFPGRVRDECFHGSKTLVRLADARRFLVLRILFPSLVIFGGFLFLRHFFVIFLFGSLDDEHLLPTASNAEAVVRVGCNMIDTALVLQKRQSGSQSCRGTASHFESNVFFSTSIAYVLSSKSKFCTVLILKVQSRILFWRFNLGKISVILWSSLLLWFWKTSLGIQQGVVSISAQQVSVGDVTVGLLIGTWNV